jgi:hypothetical protein
MTEKAFRKDDDEYEQQRNDMGLGGGGVSWTCGMRAGEDGAPEGDGLQGQRDEAGRQNSG